MVDSSKTDLATEEDKAWEIDHRARLFKAKTWEELKMIADKDAEIARLKQLLENK